MSISLLVVLVESCSGSSPYIRLWAEQVSSDVNLDQTGLVYLQPRPPPSLPASDWTASPSLPGSDWTALLSADRLTSHQISPPLSLPVTIHKQDGVTQRRQQQQLIGWLPTHPQSGWLRGKPRLPRQSDTQKQNQ
ncbi:hypothetical protein EYF80_030772 [Liparis tanakae]|uniref:Uncharacterized protein n=1 Tax=Liparis tanakae TaxID=230148 RepID=A0A4Z2H2J1_9TELE|nr:hypothetical protein EYF80_030772 [Liparis tanakae]